MREISVTGLYRAVKTIYYRHLRRFMKFVPILGLLLLIALYHGNTAPTESQEGEFSLEQLKTTLINTGVALKNSFDFSDKLQLLTTAVLLITLWTGYKYWLVKIRFIRSNSGLLEKLIIISMIFIFVNYHVKITSSLGIYVDWLLFLLTLYLVVVGSWFLAKVIDSIDLRSDLYCWGLRLLGLLVMGFGALLFSVSTLVMFDGSKLVFENIFWILSLCIMLLGAFMEYRSFRRHPALHVW